MIMVMFFFFADKEFRDIWKLKFNSPSLAKLFDLKNSDIVKHAQTSFCGNLLEAIDLESHFERIRDTFSKCIKFKRYFFPDPQKDQHVIYVFEVDVVLREDKITVVERVCKTLFIR